MRARLQVSLPGNQHGQSAERSEIEDDPLDRLHYSDLLVYRLYNGEAKINELRCFASMFVE